MKIRVIAFNSKIKMILEFVKLVQYQFPSTIIYRKHEFLASATALILFGSGRICRIKKIEQLCQAENALKREYSDKKD